MKEEGGREKDRIRPVVVKVGGSLYDLADLSARLQRFLRELSGDVILVPGGGAVVDVLRQLDRRHELGEEGSHWLALRALSLNAHFLAQLLPEGRVRQRLEDCQGLCILDMLAFAQADKGCPGCLPHCWSVTSDSLAARVARVSVARELILLKSVTIPPALAWTDAARAGWVDARFAETVRQAGPSLTVRTVNFR